MIVFKKKRKKKFCEIQRTLSVTINRQKTIKKGCLASEINSLFRMNINCVINAGFTFSSIFIINNNNMTQEERDLLNEVGNDGRFWDNNNLWNRVYVDDQNVIRTKIVDSTLTPVLSGLTSDIVTAIHSIDFTSTTINNTVNNTNNNYSCPPPAPIISGSTCTITNYFAPNTTITIECGDFNYDTANTINITDFITIQATDGIEQLRFFCDASLYYSVGPNLYTFNQMAKGYIQSFNYTYTEYQFIPYTFNNDSIRTFMVSGDTNQITKIDSNQITKTILNNLVCCRPKNTGIISFLLPLNVQKLGNISIINNHLDLNSVNNIFFVLDYNGVEGGSCEIANGTTAKANENGLIAKNRLLQKNWRIIN